MNILFLIRVTAVTTGIFVLGGCTFMKDADVGNILGAIGGSRSASDVSGGERDLSILGGILGTLGNDNVSQTLNDEDRALMAELVFVVLDHGPDELADTWRNRKTRHHGSFIAHSTWRTSDDIECRRFTNMIYIPEREARATGTACRQRDGTWAIIG